MGLYRVYRDVGKDNGNYYNGLYRDYRVLDLGIMENQMEKKMENEMETGVI